MTAVAGKGRVFSILRCIPGGVANAGRHSAADMCPGPAPSPCYHHEHPMQPAPPCSQPVQAYAQHRKHGRSRPQASKLQQPRPRVKTFFERPENAGLPGEPDCVGTLVPTLNFTPRPTALRQDTSSLATPCPWFYAYPYPCRLVHQIKRPSGCNNL